MRLTEFVYGIIENFAPMSEKSAVELKTDSMAWYSKAEKEATEIEEIKTENARLMALAEEADNEKEAEKLLALMKDEPKASLSHKAVKASESWIVRTLFALLYIYIIPKIQNYLNPKPESGRRRDDDEYEDEYYED